jgi:hypothetical protein
MSSFIYWRDRIGFHPRLVESYGPGPIGFLAADER